MPRRRSCRSAMQKQAASAASVRPTLRNMVVAALFEEARAGKQGSQWFEWYSKARSDVSAEEIKRLRA